MLSLSQVPQHFAPAKAVAPTDKPAPNDCKSPSAAAEVTARAAPSMSPSHVVMTTIEIANPAAVFCLSGNSPHMSGQKPAHVSVACQVGARCQCSAAKGTAGDALYLLTLLYLLLLLLLI